MKKGILLCALLALSCVAHGAEPVYTGPDCSKDVDARIVGGITDSLQLESPVNQKHRHYFLQLIGKDVTREITRLSSELISKEEAKRLMLRRAKMDGNDRKEDISPGGSLYGMYMEQDLYRQYYLIESNKGFRAIAEYYSSYYQGKWPVGSKEGESCGNDLENIYIISDVIYGHTADFASL